MPITIIPDTGVNTIYVNQNTGLNIILSGVSEQNSVNISGAGGAITPHNNLNGLQGGQFGQYYHLTSDEYANLNTGIDISLYYLASNPSGYITIDDLPEPAEPPDLSPYATIEFVSSGDYYLEEKINLLENATGDYYPRTNPSGYITGINQVSFSTLLPTGIEETGISFPYSLLPNPRVFAELIFNSDTGYYVGVKNISTTGYTAIFSDILTETGLYLQTLATNL